MDVIESDIRTMIGGSFTQHSLAPPDYEAILGRARANADAYLDRFERDFLGVSFDAELHSNFHAEVLLRNLRDVAPERVRSLAAALKKQYDAVLVIYDQFPDKAMLDEVLPPRTANYLIRLSERRRELARLAEGP